jgi:nucleoid-associated protein YgaU
MSFAKLTIIPEKGDKIKASYNPEHYSVTKGVQVAEIGIPGLDSPVLQFVRGQNEKVTLELFFDTTEKGMVENVQDVRELTRPVYNLMRVNTETHAPLRFRIEWGQTKSLIGQGAGVSPLCVLESMTQEFTLFSPGGVPLRAKLNLTIREASTAKIQFQTNPRHSTDRTKLRTVVRGQTISEIAWLEYGDPSQWRPIAEASGLDNPRFLSPGTVLKVPRNVPGANT